MVYTLSGVRFPTVPSVYKSNGFTSSNGDRRNANVSVFLKKHSLSRKILAEKSSYDSESRPSTVAASGKVLVPGTQSDSSSSSTDQFEFTETAPENSPASTDVDSSTMEQASQIKTENGDVEPSRSTEELEFASSDVYNGRGTLEEGETAEARFIKIQAAYELLIDADERRKYDKDNRVNPMKASEAWVEWLMKKRKAFDQRGDMAIAAWAEQQQLELNLKARRLARSKMDPEEERRIIAKERKASVENFNNTLKRHTLVLRKRDIMRRKSEEEKKRVISRLLAAEGLELAEEDDKNL